MTPSVKQADFIKLLSRFAEENVSYVLIGGQAVRLNGFVRSTEDIDILLPSSIENGRRVIRALDFLASAQELDPAWFEVDFDEPQNICMQDELYIDLMFAANSQTYETLKNHIREVELEGTIVKILDIEGLLKTKTNYREKDLIDRQVLSRLQDQLKKEKQKEQDGERVKK